MMCLPNDLAVPLSTILLLVLITNKVLNSKPQQCSRTLVLERQVAALSKQIALIGL